MYFVIHHHKKENYELLQKRRQTVTNKRKTTADEALANRVVALGVGRCDHSGRAINGGDFYHPTDDSEIGGYCAELFVRLWEVAGALMEKCTKLPDNHEIQLCRNMKEGVQVDEYICHIDDDTGREELLMKLSPIAPHAVTLACVEALETK